MEGIKPGAKLTVSKKADDTLLARTMGSGTLEVLATPAVIAAMENAAAALIEPALGSGLTSVGTMISIKHISATPKGADFSATAQLISTDGRKYVFSVTAYDKAGLIAEGTHERCTVKSESFMQRTEHKF